MIVRNPRTINIGLFLTSKFKIMANKKTVFISAKTGRYVKSSYAKQHPNTTVKMTVKKRG